MASVPQFPLLCVLHTGLLCKLHAMYLQCAECKACIDTVRQWKLLLIVDKHLRKTYRITWGWIHQLLYVCLQGLRWGLQVIQPERSVSGATGGRPLLLPAVTSPEPRGGHQVVQGNWARSEFLYSQREMSPPSNKCCRCAKRNNMDFSICIRNVTQQALELSEIQKGEQGTWRGLSLDQALISTVKVSMAVLECPHPQIMTSQQRCLTLPSKESVQQWSGHDLILLPSTIRVFEA